MHALRDSASRSVPAISSAAWRTRACLHNVPTRMNVSAFFTMGMRYSIEIREDYPIGCTQPSRARKETDNCRMAGEAWRIYDCMTGAIFARRNESLQQSSTSDETGGGGAMRDIVAYKGGESGEPFGGAEIRYGRSARAHYRDVEKVQGVPQRNRLRSHPCRSGDSCHRTARFL